MYELLPDLWLQADDREAGICSGKRRRVMDIKVWAQCFANYIRVVAVNEPEKVADLLSYMIDIIRASQDFEGSAWVTYDDTFRRQVANNKEKIWSNINTSLFLLCFTSKARTSRRCEFCFTTYHMSGPHRCPLQDNGEIGPQQQNTEVADRETSGNTSSAWRTQVRHGPDAVGLMKATAICWIAHTGMSVLYVGVDTLRCFVSKGLEKGTLPTSQNERPFPSATILSMKCRL